MFDSASVKRGRGRPRKTTVDESKLVSVENPVAQGSVSDILKMEEPENGMVKAMGPAPLLEYRIEFHGQPGELSANVNKLLQSGWNLAGNLLTTPQGLFVQALTRTTL